MSTENKKKDGRKVSLYMPEELVAQVREQSARLDRSFSWVVQRAFKIAKAELAAMPAATDDEQG